MWKVLVAMPPASDMPRSPAGANTSGHETPLWDVLAGARVLDLAHALSSSAPSGLHHPGFRMALMRRHGDQSVGDDASTAHEMIALGGHSGTHVDALCHVAHHGRLYGGYDAAESQRGGRFHRHGLETLAPFLGRGVMLDVARLHGVDILAPGHAISGDELDAAATAQRVEVRAGDAVLIRTGWAALWTSPEKFLGTRTGTPGPDRSAARWLADRRIAIAGGETLGFEHVPVGADRPPRHAHTILIVDHGIPIVEALDLTPLSTAERFEFLFILAPLKITGATGGPVRPLALVR